VTRNIVKFAGTGEVRIGRLDEPTRCGLLVVARDAGPGIGDVDLALSDGHSTYGGLGLGLPGAGGSWTSSSCSRSRGRARP
jgi:serine/threonine-protein kinase RsbT